MAVHKIEPDDNIISQISSVEHLAVITVMGVTSTCIGVHVQCICTFHRHGSRL